MLVQVYDIVSEAVELEEEFICDALNVSLVGMNASLMAQYIKFCADRLLVALGWVPACGVMQRAHGLVSGVSQCAPPHRVDVSIPYPVSPNSIQDVLVTGGWLNSFWGIFSDEDGCGGACPALYTASLILYLTERHPHSCTAQVWQAVQRAQPI